MEHVNRGGGLGVVVAMTKLIAAIALATALGQNAHEVTWTGSDIGGPGAELLERELATTQFFLIGEDHGFAEIPKITTALLQRGWKHGYRHLGIEVGPVSIARLASAKGDVAAYNRRYPWAIPFLTWEEEARLYAEAMKLGGGKPDAVWGLDQEFVISPTSHFERLLALAQTDNARTTAKAMLERARSGDKAMIETKSPRAVFLMSAKQADFDALRAAFAGDKRAEVKLILDALEETWSIYSKNFTGDIYGNNEQRVRLIKRYFAERYHAAVARGEKQPKVLLKFGASHMMRGRTVVNVFDLGTTLPELAAMNGTRAFQLLIIPGGGRVNAWRPFSPSEDAKSAPYVPKYAGVDLAPITSVANGWTLIDLRPLRADLSAGRIEPIDRGLEAMLWGYDAVLVIPSATAAKNLD